MQTRRTAIAALAALPFAGRTMAQGAAPRIVDAGGRRIAYLMRQAGDAPAPMLLCFGGGNADRAIMEYYRAIYTPQSVYRDHHVILPIGSPDRYFYQFSNGEVRALLGALTAAEPIAGRGLISGVSNGGRAAFRFAAAAPEAFRGIITMPGALIGDPIPAAWRDYSVLLAYGTKDPKWQAESERAYTALNGRVSKVQLAALTGQGHVVGPGYDIDPVYARLKGMEGG